MQLQKTMMRWTAVLAIAATVVAPTGAWAEDGRGHGGGGRDGGGEVELRHGADDGPLHEADDRGGDRVAEPGDDRGDDDGVAAPAVAAPAPAPVSVQAGAVALNVVEGRTAQDWTYAPAQLNTTVGTTLIWTNTGRDDHTVTSADGTMFDSRNMSPGGTFTFTPTVAGTFAYLCAYHPWMTGSINVAP